MFYPIGGAADTHWGVDDLQMSCLNFVPGAMSFVKIPRVGVVTGIKKIRQKTLAKSNFPGCGLDLPVKITPV